MNQKANVMKPWKNQSFAPRGVGLRCMNMKRCFCNNTPANMMRSARIV